VIHRLLVALLLAGTGLLALLPPESGAVAPARSEDDRTRLVYMGDNGPMLIEVRLRLDKRSYAAAWEKLMDEVFAYLDQDKDGVLSAREALSAPPPSVLASSLFLFTDAGRPPTPPKGADRSGKVTRQELAEHYKRSGLAPFQVTYSARSPGFATVGGPQTISPEALNARLFELLDTDHDGKLSRRELEAAATVLADLDADEDELIDRNELMGKAGPASELAYASAYGDDSSSSIPESRRPIHAVTSGRDEALGRLLLARYGKKGRKALEGEALGLSKEATARLDADGDGRLDAKELAAYAAGHPDVTLRVDVGGKAGANSPFMMPAPPPKKEEKSKDKKSMDKKAMEKPPAPKESTARKEPPAQAQAKEAKAKEADAKRMMTLFKPPAAPTNAETNVALLGGAPAGVKATAD